MHEIIVKDKYEGMRLDVFASLILDLSRSACQKLIADGHIKVNDKMPTKKYNVIQGDVVICKIPQPEEYQVLPEDIPLDIVYEDSDIIVINKPQNMVVHPAPGNYSGTLVNALMHHCSDLSGVNGVLRPGIVHRLDKDTSGLIVVAKHDKAHNGLAAQLAERKCKRIYYAIVKGVLTKDSMTIKTNIGRHSKDRKKMAVVPAGKGKEAITHIQVLERFKSSTLVEAKLETGRTHQIRVHMLHIGHPVLGDPVYSPVKDGRQFLHAKILGFDHPITGEGMCFETKLPGYFEIASTP